MSALAVVVALLSGAQVEQVVVFPDRALVTRSEVVACGPKARAVFAHLTPAAAADSFRARSSVGQVVGLRSVLQPRREALSPQLRALEAQARQLALQLDAVAKEKARAEAKVRRAEALAELGARQISKELPQEGAEPKRWEQAFDTSLDARLKANKQLVALEAKARGLRAQLAQAQVKMQGLEAGAARAEHEVEVLVACASGQATVELTYLVGGARWEPAWEARALEAQSQVALSAWATVRQSTGEDWAQAKVVLSTAVPAQNATPPAMSTLTVTAEQREPPKKVLTRRDEEVARADAPGAAGPTSPAELSVRAQGLSVQLEVPGRQTVKGDGEPMRLFVARAALPATFALRAAPRLSPWVYEVAEVTNRAPFPLLPGPLDVFRSSGFVARTTLARVAEGARFTLSLGVEDGVRLTRVVKEEVKRAAGAFGGKQRFGSSYRFEVASYKTEAVTVEVQEAVPLSELEDVAVTIEPSTTAGYTRDREDGIVKWAVKLRPKEKAALTLAWSVDVPGSYDTSGW